MPSVLIFLFRFVKQ